MVGLLWRGDFFYRLLCILFLQKMDILGYVIFFHIRYALLVGLTIRGAVMLLTSPKAIFYATAWPGARSENTCCNSRKILRWGSLSNAYAETLHTLVPIIGDINSIT